MKLLPLRNSKNPIESLKYLLDIEFPLELYIWRAGYADQGSIWDESLSRTMFDKIMSSKRDSKAVIHSKNSFAAPTNKIEVVNNRRKKPFAVKKAGPSGNKNRQNISTVQLPSSSSSSSQSSSSSSSSSSSFAASLVASNPDKSACDGNIFAERSREYILGP